MKTWIHLALGALLGVSVASCGGGSSSVAEGGIGGTGISSGSISAFGSIVVNGTRFDVDAAQITVNGSPTTQSALDVGYVVRVDGDLDDGVADSVRFDADLIGEVDENQITAGESIGTLTVMQQTVVVTATTVIENGLGPDAIKDFVNDGSPDRVLVSGFRDSSDVLVATHLEVGPATVPDQIVGRVSQSQANRFQINDLVVISSEEPDLGERVLVRGDYDPASGQMPGPNTVGEVEDLVTAGAEIELEGIVSEFAGLSSFKVDGVPVDASGATIVDETGAPAAGKIANDVEVEVEGVFGVIGTPVLIADRVEVELEDNVEIVAQVQTVDPVTRTIGLFNDGSGTLVTVVVNDSTRLTDKRDDLKNFSLADLVEGVDWVELDAFEDGDTNPTDPVTALKLERIESQSAVSVEGIVDGRLPTFGLLNILGVVFDTRCASFEDDIDLSDIAADDIVEVTWTDADAFSSVPSCTLSEPDTGTFTQPQPVEEVELEEDRTP